MATPGAAASLLAPGLGRRLACFVYEGVVLFGVVMIAGLLYGTVTQQRHALIGMHGLQLVLFLALGAYFSWFWSHGGQTVAMKTWRIRLLTRDGGPVTALRAFLRYVLSWLWFLPALAWAHLAGFKTGASVSLSLAIGVMGYAALSMANNQRQYVHDLLCGTRLVNWPARKPSTG